MWLLLRKVMKFEFACVLEKEKITLYDYRLNPITAGECHIGTSTLVPVQ